jgi:prepilin-type N-terminal cleavage/methylation domain-containing protein
MVKFEYNLKEEKKMNKRGVTLIELVIVFVIIAVMAVLMVPNIGGWLPNYRLRNAIREVASTMRMAQMRAISNRVQYRVSFNTADVGATTPPGYVLQRDSGGGAFVNDEAIRTLPSGITITANLFPNERAVFNTNSTSSGGSITLQNTKGATRTITLTTATGRVSAP